MARLNYLSVRQGTKYGPEYTTALKNQVKGLVCLGDDRPLRTRLSGWYSKFELCAPWNADLRPALFFDLDTYVVGSLDVFDDLDHSQFWMINDFGKKSRAESGILLIPDAPVSDSIWTCHETHDNRVGDAAYFGQFPHQRLNDEISGIYSYKHHCREKKPDDARIICFHGRPNPPDTDGWALQHWITNTSVTKTS